MEKEEGAGSVTFFDDSDHSDDHNNSVQEVITSIINKSLSQNTNASEENNNASLSTDKMFYKKNNKRKAKKIEKMKQDDPISKRLKAESRASKPKLTHKESECLTILSDEEEESRTKKFESVNNNALLSNASNAFNEDTNTILEKELVVTSTSVSHSCNDYLANKESSTGICDNEQLSQIAIECQMVIIGSYKCIPKENVIISHTGVRFNIPSLENATSFVTLDVQYKDICKLLVHFGISLPVLFFYTSPSSGAMIRELLGMQDPKGPYYDPIGKYDFTHRRITVLSNKLLDYSRPKLNSIFLPTNKIVELNPKEAHDIFVRASPRDMFYKKNNKRNAKKIEKMKQDDPISKRLKAESRASKPKLTHKESEESRAEKIESINNNTPLNNASNAFHEDINTLLEKKLVITSTSIFHSSNNYLANNKESSTGICDNESLLDNEQLSQIAIECQMVIIGSYKCIPKENVIISHTGVRFNIPSLEDATSFVTLDVKYEDIIKLLVYFGKALSILFFYTSPSSGDMIRKLLGMQDPKEPYYDPTGKDFTHRHITVLSNKLLDYSRPKLNSIFSCRKKINELNSKQAYDIFVRTSFRDNDQSHNTVIRKQNQSCVPNIADVNDNIQAITIYPPPPAKGGIAINTEDYLCLAEDQFLNDVIIDFYLKYLSLEILSESDQRRTHVFSSYFYKRMIRPHAQTAESVMPMTPAAKRYARVQKWTKNVNIFEKDFIIIPINKYKHWFLAIICFPGLVGKVSTSAKKTIKNDVQKVVKKLKELKTKAVTIDSTITPVPTTITIDQLDYGYERDEVEGDDDEIEIDKEDETEQPEENTIQTQVKLEQQKEIVKIPCILIFDSLAGTSRSRVIATLRDYLSCEYVNKFGTEKTFSKDTIKGAYPKVPQQSNLTDCGLYVLQYVESFFKDPIKDYTLPIKNLKTWFDEIIVTRKREELSKLLIRLINNTKGNKTISLPTINFPTSDGKLKPKSKTQTDAKATKPEGKNKKKSTNVETETRIVSQL